MRRSRSSVGARRWGARAARGVGGGVLEAADFRAAGLVERFGAAFLVADALARFAAGALRDFRAAALTVFLRAGVRRAVRLRAAARRLADRGPAARRDDLADALRAPRAFLFAIEQFLSRP